MRTYVIVMFTIYIVAAFIMAVRITSRSEKQEYPVTKIRTLGGDIVDMIVHIAGAIITGLILWS